MQALILGRADNWWKIEDLLLDRYELTFSSILQAKPASWDSSIETHRIGHLFVNQLDEKQLEQDLSVLKAEVFFSPTISSVLNAVVSLADERSLSVSVGV